MIVMVESLTYDQREPRKLVFDARAEIKLGLLFRSSYTFVLTPDQIFVLVSAPQKGRYRQFHQIGVNFLVWFRDIDAELIILSARIVQEASALSWSMLKLQLKNTIGLSTDVKQFKVAFSWNIWQSFKIS